VGFCTFGGLTMDEFIRKKILYFLKYEYDKAPYKHIDLLEHFEIDVSVIKRNALYLSNKHLIEQILTIGGNHLSARITDDGIDFVEEDLKYNYELNILEFIRENLGKGKLDFDEFPEYLFPDRQNLNAKLLKYEHSDVANIFATGFPKQVDCVFPKDTLINRLEDLKVNKEIIKSVFERQSPNVNIANIEQMIGSQLQQGTKDSIQEGTFEIENHDQLLKFIELLKTKLPELEISEDDKSEIETDVSTIEAQIKSSRPKAGIIKESLLSIKRILEGASGAVIATGLLKYLLSLLGV